MTIAPKLTIMDFENKPPGKQFLDVNISSKHNFDVDLHKEIHSGI